MFDAKMVFTCETRWALNGHTKPYPIGSRCIGVVSRESSEIDFVHASLNKLDVFVVDIRNSYLPSPLSDNFHAA